MLELAKIDCAWLFCLAKMVLKDSGYYLNLVFCVP